jgi:WD40 repeat protein
MKNQKNKHHYLIVFIFTILVGIIFAQADEMSAVVGDSGANVKPLKVSNEAPATPLDKISRIAFSPDGNALANVDDGGAITLRDVTTGLTLWDRFDPLNDVVTSLAFSLDGKTLASSELSSAIAVKRG